MLSLWYTDQNHNNACPPPLARLLGLKMKCQNPEAEGDHNKLIINRKWLHYRLKDRRECSLVTALTQIHTFLQGLERAGSPPWAPTGSPARCLSPRAIAQGTAGALNGSRGPQGGAGGLWVSRVAWQSGDTWQLLPCDFCTPAARGCVMGDEVTLLVW